MEPQFESMRVSETKEEKAQKDSQEGHIARAQVELEKNRDIVRGNRPFRSCQFLSSHNLFTTFAVVDLSKE